MDLYADECVHRSTPFRLPHYGRQGVRDYLTQAFADEQRFDEVGFGTPVVQGDRAWVEYWAGAWLAVDPTSLAEVGDRHVMLARGRDYADVSPTRGSCRGSTPPSTMPCWR